MVDLVLSQDAFLPPRSARVRRSHRVDRLFHRLTLICAFFVLVLFAGIFWALVAGAWPAIQAFGLPFIWTQIWNPVTQKFGGLAPIAGTLITSFLAMLVAIPVGIGIAIFLTEICPRPMRRPIGIAVELLAGIPSIIYGIWGLFVLAPVLQQSVIPAIIATFEGIPVLSSLFAGPPYGIGMFTAALILSVMTIPFISAITRDVFETVPPVLKESTYALGATTTEVVWGVVLPFTRIGVAGGILLGLGRALGETMAVTFVIGNSHHIHASILQPGTTISAALANEFTEAVGDLYQSSLIALGFILFLITFVVLAIAKLLLIRLQQQAGVQR
jgi:phosphate transport system permease protein